MTDIPTNVIHCGDNLEIMRNMPDESVNLIYLDPPFFSNRHYEVIWGDDNETRSFDDRWEGGIEHYIGWMRDRLVEMYRILAKDGVIYLHCDNHASHYLKIEMDKIFGRDNSKNEIIWKRSSGSGGKTAGKKYVPNHDTIFVYSKGGDVTFNTQYYPVTEEWIRKNSFKENGELWYWSHYGRKEKKLVSERKGIKVDDIWVDIPSINEGIRGRKERLGYPTQKPEALLDRIIKTATNEKDIAFDPFCGCGTALAVSQKLGRKWIGIDVSPVACDVIATRLNIPHWKIRGMPMTTSELAKLEPYEFQQWVCTRMEAKNTSPDPAKHGGADGGIDGIVKSNLLTFGCEGSYLQVKRSKGVGVNTVKNLYATMDERGIKTGFIVALSFGKGAVEKVATYKNAGKAEIILVNAEDIAEKGYFNE